MAHNKVVTGIASNTISTGQMVYSGDLVGYDTGTYGTDYTYYPSYPSLPTEKNVEVIITPTYVQPKKGLDEYTTEELIAEITKRIKEGRYN